MESLYPSKPTCDFGTHCRAAEETLPLKMVKEVHPLGKKDVWVLGEWNHNDRSLESPQMWHWLHCHMHWFVFKVLSFFFINPLQDVLISPLCSWHAHCSGQCEGHWRTRNVHCGPHMAWSPRLFLLIPFTIPLLLLPHHPPQNVSHQIMIFNQQELSCPPFATYIWPT